MFADFKNNYKKEIDQQILKLIAEQPIPQKLKEAMIYSVEVGGKRLRPILLFAVLEALGGDVKRGYRTAAALEMIHTYSLIHDDLPAMDDDDVRRGKPTNHKVFGEATAILAGDALLTDAFSVLSQDETLDVNTRLRLISELAQAAGGVGMVAGQALDMEAENKQISLADLKHIHAHKTGCLIKFAIVAGAIIGNANEETLQSLRQFADHLGLAFQIKDDILDVEGDSELMGKAVGSDLLNEKCTYVSLTSLEAAKLMLDEEIRSALNILEQLPLKKEILEAIIIYIKERQA